MSPFRTLTVAFILIPACLTAQEFRAGQWGVQFAGGLSLPSIGVMRFTGPRTAWLLDLNFSGRVMNGTRPDGGGGTADADERAVSFSADLGKRFYQDVRQQVRTHQSIGLTGGYLNQKTNAVTGPDIAFNQWFGGVFGELGGAYWVVPSLSVGATGSIAAGYLHEKRTDFFGTLERTGFSVSGVELLFVVGLYF
jgi:hypothetical protein